MKVEIRDNNRKLFQNYFTMEEMNPQQRLRLREKVTEHIRSFFRWEDYGDEFRHLVYYAELDGMAHVYVNGYIMTEKEFDEYIRFREGIGYVGAFHKGTSDFGKR